MEQLEIMRRRRSIRKYTQEPIAEDALRQILQAGLLSASSRAKQPWEFIAVKDRETLKRLSECRAGAAKMLAGAACAVVVIADPEITDVWTEDCSIAMANMHLMASSLGVGSCWIQGRLREAPDGDTTENYLRSILNYPPGYKLEAILSLGMPGEEKEAHKLEELPYDKVHWETY